MVTAHSAPRAIVCGFCGLEFVENRGQPTCRSCPLSGGCPMIRCPTCGYENLAPRRWLDRVLGRRNAR